MADGRRSESHDAELLRSVFVILSGGPGLHRRRAPVLEAAAHHRPDRHRRLLRHHPQPLVDALTRLKMRRGRGHLDRVPPRRGGLRRAGLHVRPADLRRRPELRPGHPRLRRTGPERRRPGRRAHQAVQHRREGGRERPQAPGRARATPAARRCRTAQRVASGLLALLTIMVLSFLMLLEAPDIIGVFLGLLSPHHAVQVRRIGAGRAPGPSPATWPATC